MLFVALFVQIALPEEMRDGHADNGRNGNGQSGFKSKIDQRHFRCLGGQYHITGGWRQDNRRRRSADSRRCTAADADINHQRE
ncbi:hypothetical protein D3C78_1819840 [compost metagenome]